MVRSKEINVVAFSIDKRGRLIGTIEQNTETGDQDELAFYVELLARESDTFERGLTGADSD